MQRYCHISSIIRWVLGLDREIPASWKVTLRKIIHWGLGGWKLLPPGPCTFTRFSFALQFEAWISNKLPSDFSRGSCWDLQMREFTRNDPPAPGESSQMCSVLLHFSCRDCMLPDCPFFFLFFQSSDHFCIRPLSDLRVCVKSLVKTKKL